MSSVRAYNSAALADRSQAHLAAGTAQARRDPLASSKRRLS